MAIVILIIVLVLELGVAIRFAPVGAYAAWVSLGLVVASLCVFVFQRHIDLASMTEAFARDELELYEARKDAIEARNGWLYYPVLMTLVTGTVDAILELRRGVSAGAVLLAIVSGLSLAVFVLFRFFLPYPIRVI